MMELLQKYAERFGENFPLFTLMGAEEAEIEAILQKCLEDGEPYRPADPGEDVLY